MQLQNVYRNFSKVASQTDFILVFFPESKQGLGLLKLGSVQVSFGQLSWRVSARYGPQEVGGSKGLNLLSAPRPYATA